MRLLLRIQLALLDNLVWVLLIVFFIFNAIFTPAFFSFDNQVNILFQSTMLGMLVLAQGMVMMVGELDLSLDATLAFAPGIAILLSTTLPIPPLYCIILTLILGMLVGLFNGIFVAKVKANSFLFTLAGQIVMRGIILFLVPFSISGLAGAYTVLGRFRIADLIPIAVVVLLVMFIAFELIFRKTIFGRKFTLTGGNRQAAFISGIRTDRVIIMAFVIAGLLAAIAGLIAAGRQNAVSNSMGLNLVTMSIAGAILGGCSFNGGVGKPIGMLGGALLLGMIDNALTLRGVNVNLVSATKGALIFVALLLDRWRYRATADLMRKENIKKLSAEDALKT